MWINKNIIFVVSVFHSSNIDNCLPKSFSFFILYFSTIHESHNKWHAQINIYFSFSLICLQYYIINSSKRHVKTNAIISFQSFVKLQNFIYTINPNAKFNSWLTQLFSPLQKKSSYYTTENFENII